MNDMKEKSANFAPDFRGHGKSARYISHND